MVKKIWPERGTDPVVNLPDTAYNAIESAITNRFPTIPCDDAWELVRLAICYYREATENKGQDPNQKLYVSPENRIA